MKLTIVITQSEELGLEYLRWNFESLKRWNADGLPDTEFVVICQRRGPGPVVDLCNSTGLPVQIIHPAQEFVGPSPVWDILASLRESWPLFGGDYVSFHHPEFIWTPGSLRRTIDHLVADAKKYIVLGNLRRPAVQGSRYVRNSCASSLPLMEAMERGEWERAVEIVGGLHTTHWIFWGDEPQKAAARWLEDVFFADRSWLEAWRMPDHGAPQPFQDVYDLMGRALQIMPRECAAPPITRMSLETNRIIHLWHPRAWDTWTPEMRDYFLKRPEYAGTELHNPLLWPQLIKLRQQKDTGSFRALIQLRTGPRGTVTRYGHALRSWLAHGGGAKLREFMKS
jgi:hypothetical protein